LVARKSKGIALIEVLVAVLVLGVGLLGLAALQGMSTKMTNNAQQRTQAVMLSGDILERIRVNRQNRANYNGININDPACAVNFVPAAGAAVSANDINEWSNLLGCLLPGAVATVNIAADVVTVRITWTSQDNASPPVVVRTVI
jgi:type IV pilus assembly protein PilV